MARRFSMDPRRGGGSGRGAESRRGWAVLAALAATTLGVAACGDPYVPPLFSAIELEGGDEQTGKVCTPLGEPLVVGAFNQFDEYLPGARIHFFAEDGSFDPAIAMTGADGRVRVTYTLGATPGPQRVTALAWDGNLSLEFNFIAEPDPPATLRRISGHNQSAPAGQPLSNPLVVRVSDACGAGVPGVPVAWSTSSDGQLATAASTTDGNGFTSNTLILPHEPGALTVAATAEGYGPISFTATATDE